MVFTTLARIAVTRGLQPRKEPDVAVALKKVSAKSKSEEKSYGQFISPPVGDMDQTATKGRLVLAISQSPSGEFKRRAQVRRFFHRRRRPISTSTRIGAYENQISKFLMKVGPEKKIWFLFSVFLSEKNNRLLWLNLSLLRAAELGRKRVKRPAISVTSR